jgi:hypothetical protein
MPAAGELKQYTGNSFWGLEGEQEDRKEALDGGGAEHSETGSSGRATPPPASAHLRATALRASARAPPAPRPRGATCPRAACCGCRSPAWAAPPCLAPLATAAAAACCSGSRRQPAPVCTRAAPCPACTSAPPARSIRAAAACARPRLGRQHCRPAPPPAAWAVAVCALGPARPERCHSAGRRLLLRSPCPAPALAPAACLC